MGLLREEAAEERVRVSESSPRFFSVAAPSGAHGSLLKMFRLKFVKDALEAIDGLEVRSNREFPCQRMPP